MIKNWFFRQKLKMNNLEIPENNASEMNITGHIGSYTTDESSGVSCIKILGRHYSEKDEIEYYFNGKFNKKEIIGIPVKITYKLVVNHDDVKRWCKSIEIITDRWYIF